MGYRKLFMKLRFVDHLHRKQCDDIVKKAELFYRQLPVLDVLSELGSASQKEVADRLHISPPAITNTVKRLTKHGYVEWEVSENDRRLHRLALTEKGRKEHLICFGKLNQMDHEVLDGIDPEDLKVFEKVLDQMIEKLHSLEKGEQND